MSSLKRQFSLMILVASFSSAAFADEDHAFLDAPYPAHAPLLHSVRGPFDFITHPADVHPAPDKSETGQMIEKITPIRNQGARGTCSIFSATAMLEAMMVIDQGADASTLDLSEEWLEYVITRESGADGSTSTRNFLAFAQYGDVDETLLPYIGETWKTTSDSPLAEARCGKLADFELTRCLVAHRDGKLLDATESVLSDTTNALYDPEFLKARQSAETFREDKLAHIETTDFQLADQAEVKAVLAAGAPVTLDLDFYYGAWNHREGVDLGLVRDMNNWQAGIVGYPEPGSIDRDKSPTNPAGHSVLLVGYDDNGVVTTTSQMNDGTTKTFTYKGVYYFKNSWGTTNFGTVTMIDGKIRPGYGVITQKYAEEFGTFYKLTLK